MCAGVGIADTGGLAGSASDFAVPANTGEMAAHFAMQFAPPGAASSSLSPQQQNNRRYWPYLHSQSVSQSITFPYQYNRNHTG